MEKLDKEAIADNYFGEEDAGTNVYALKACKDNYKAGLEYAENHYLKLIEEKDKEINRIQKLGEEVLEAYDYNTAKLQTVKELLKETKFHVYRGENDDIFNKIEEFLKQ